MKIRVLGHVSLYVRDLEATRRFSRDLLGLAETGTGKNGRIVFFSAGAHHHDLSCELARAEGPGPQPKGVPGLYHIAFDVGASLEDLASKGYGHYQINTDRQAFVKYMTSKKPPWTFTFAPDELQAIRSSLKSGDKVYVCLVCGSVTICCLSEEELKGVIDASSAAAQWIRVEVPNGGRRPPRAADPGVRWTMP